MNGNLLEARENEAVSVKRLLRVAASVQETSKYQKLASQRWTLRGGSWDLVTADNWACNWSNFYKATNR